MVSSLLHYELHFIGYAVAAAACWSSYRPLPDFYRRLNSYSIVHEQIFSKKKKKCDPSADRRRISILFIRFWCDPRVPFFSFHIRSIILVLVWCQHCVVFSSIYLATEKTKIVLVVGVWMGKADRYRWRVWICVCLCVLNRNIEYTYWSHCIARITIVLCSTRKTWRCNGAYVCSR